MSDTTEDSERRIIKGVLEAQKLKEPVVSRIEAQKPDWNLTVIKPVATVYSEAATNQYAETFCDYED